jgi:hypothetical protein
VILVPARSLSAVNNNEKVEKNKNFFVKRVKNIIETINKKCRKT